MADIYFPWNRCSQREFRPHIRHVEPVLTECDLDWKSRLRRVPEPRYSDAPFPQIKEIKFPSEIRLTRPFPQANMASQSEWTFYPNFGQQITYHAGKRCGFYHAVKRCISEQTLESTIGRKRHVNQDCRSAAGSSTFLSPEYSPDFHKHGATVPKASFGFPTIFKADTFIPLQPLPEKICLPHTEKKKILDREEDILEVKNLSKWRPAPQLIESIIEEPGSFPNL
ncbi:spermatogenesis-associated serine-rich protein 1 [Astyanax mexicanus]|uniref:spermatogenesis-associated serine-rich protein 1 n=1 Tax=Astyanax mexicanus TaxID=7994 RepID=UPI0020CABED7|nr:spermatogenesis-associated serine-rich protein 1 [Astyanax mexicanus]